MKYKIITHQQSNTSEFLSGCPGNWPRICLEVDDEYILSENEVSEGWQLLDETTKTDLFNSLSNDFQIWETNKNNQPTWESVSANGYVDVVTGIKLKTTENARNVFTGQATMYQLAYSTGNLQLTDNIILWDFYDDEHVLTVEEFFGLILRYGMYYQTMFNMYAP